jgi:AraC-like DNA-binding protein
VLAVDEWLSERPPAPDLAAVLRCAWHGDLGAMRTPLPDECYDLVWVNDGTLWVSGPESTSWPRGYPPGSEAVGVRFHPAVGPAVLRVPAGDIRDTRVRLDDLGRTGHARALAERIAGQPDDAGRLRELEMAARRLAAEARPSDAVALQVAAEVGRIPGASLRALAAAAGISDRQLRRRCAAAFGYGPATLARVLRLQRALSLARSHGRPRRMADLAVAAGYCDQQHLAHEVRAIAGTTAGALFAIAASDPYKTVAASMGDDCEDA